ncbi:cytochrome P460 family protein [Halodesulfovibrio spirochaetisodalis]|uniref:cytochrome P460 family protein n=1 Tax=Halodesulfovibrio spirochaetisodalis TaxID=1560234 RepID=UPI0009ED1A14|nr:cytochrome P460 family protein [Halodesulfovibrio spirochaetisodalis]
MQRIRFILTLTCVAFFLASPVRSVTFEGECTATQEEWEKAFKEWDSARQVWHEPKQAPNKMPFPDSYRDWNLFSISYREDTQTLHAIMGNDVAMLAARNKYFPPWPEGTILVKVAWRQRRLPEWPEAWVPADLLAIGMMYKNKEQYADTLGWGFSIWKKEKRKLPENFGATVQECVACHAPLEKKDYVFTMPAILP